MISFARRWKYTLTAAALLTGLILWLALTGQSWQTWLILAAFIGVSAYRGITRDPH